MHHHPQVVSLTAISRGFAQSYEPLDHNDPIGKSFMLSHDIATHGLHTLSVLWLDMHASRRSWTAALASK